MAPKPRDGGGIAAAAKARNGYRSVVELTVELIVDLAVKLAVESVRELEIFFEHFSRWIAR